METENTGAKLENSSKISIEMENGNGREIPVAGGISALTFSMNYEFVSVCLGNSALRLRLRQLRLSLSWQWHCSVIYSTINCGEILLNSSTCAIFLSRSFLNVAILSFGVLLHCCSLQALQRNLSNKLFSEKLRNRLRYEAFRQSHIVLQSTVAIALFR